MGKLFLSAAAKRPYAAHDDATTHDASDPLSAHARSVGRDAQGSDAEQEADRLAHVGLADNKAVLRLL